MRRRTITTVFAVFFIILTAGSPAIKDEEEDSFLLSNEKRQFCGDCGLFGCNFLTLKCITTCSSDSDCSNGAVCISGSCKLNGCDSSAVCGNYTCDLIQKTCKKSCSTLTGAFDCKSGFHCNATGFLGSGSCVSSCKNEDCAQGYICDASGRCNERCTSSSDCAWGYLCNNSLISVDISPEATFDNPMSWLSGFGIQIGNSPTGSCIKRCVKDSDCSGNFSCNFLSGSCSNKCYSLPFSVQSGCAQGYTCLPGNQCVLPLEDGKSCSSSTTCKSKECLEGICCKTLDGTKCKTEPKCSQDFNSLITKGCSTSNGTCMEETTPCYPFKCLKGLNLLGILPDSCSKLCILNSDCQGDKRCSLGVCTDTFLEMGLRASINTVFLGLDFSPNLLSGSNADPRDHLLKDLEEIVGLALKNEFNGTSKEDCEELRQLSFVLHSNTAIAQLNKLCGIDLKTAIYYATSSLPISLEDAESTLDIVLQDATKSAQTQFLSITQIALNVLRNGQENFLIVKDQFALYSQNFSSTNQDITSNWDSSTSYLMQSGFIKEALGALKSGTILYYQLAKNPFPFLIDATVNPGTMIVSNVTGLSLLNETGETIVVKESSFNVSITIEALIVPYTKPVCLWWNEGNENWSSSGCSVSGVNSTASTVTCTCNHLTNFSVGIYSISDLEESPISSSDSANVGESVKESPPIGVYVGISIGIIFVVLGLVLIALYLHRRRNQNQVESVEKFEYVKEELITNVKELRESRYGTVYRAKYVGMFEVDLFPVDPSIPSQELQQQASIWMKLRHSNIIRLIGLYQNESTKVTYGVYEAMKETLEEYSKSRSLQETEALQIARSVASGMYYLETREILHGNLSLKNIFCKSEGNEIIIKISGLSFPPKRTKVTNPPKETKDVRWKAPEVLLKNQNSIKSDVWSWGVVLWQLFSQSSLPYPDIQESDIIQHVCIKGRRLEVQSSEDVQKLLESCFWTNPQDRPPFSFILRITKQILNEEDEGTNWEKKGLLNETEIELKVLKREMSSCVK